MSVSARALMLVATIAAGVLLVPTSQPQLQASEATCTAAVLHPLSITARPVDTVERDRSFTAQVDVTSQFPLTDGVVRLVSSGGAVVTGETEVALGDVPAGRTTRANFTVYVPDEGHRFLLQFEATGRRDGAIMRRGATLNLLPDGPAQAAERITTPGGRKLVQVKARRIDR